MSEPEPKQRKIEEEVVMKSISPNIIVKDVALSVRFYEDLGFKMVMSVPEEKEVTAEKPLEWAMVTRDAVSFMLQSLGSIKKDLPEIDLQVGQGGFHFVTMTGIDPFYASIQAMKEEKGITFLKEMHTTFYGMKEFTINDIDGNFLIFAERL